MSGLGNPVVTLGVFGNGASLGFFATSENGDGAALSRATAEIYDLARIRAVAGPLAAMVGTFDVTRAVSSGPFGKTIGVHAQSAEHTTTSWAFEVVAASTSPGGAVVAAPKDADGRLLDLLRPLAGTETDRRRSGRCAIRGKGRIEGGLGRRGSPEKRRVGRAGPCSRLAAIARSSGRKSGCATRQCARSRAVGWHAVNRSPGGSANALSRASSGGLERGCRAGAGMVECANVRLRICPSRASRRSCRVAAAVLGDERVRTVRAGRLRPWWPARRGRGVRLRRNDWELAARSRPADSRPVASFGAGGSSGRAANLWNRRRLRDGRRVRNRWRLSRRVASLEPVRIFGTGGEFGTGGVVGTGGAGNGCEQSCAGCCTSSGVCEPGDGTNACGSGGVKCLDCGSSGFGCDNGSCQGTPPKCGPGNCAGCCDSLGRCRAGTETDACGVKGGVCASCTTKNEGCDSGTCAGVPPKCGPGNCGGCCTAAGACVAGTADSACGMAGDACQSCAANGSKCNEPGAYCAFIPPCSTVTCSAGCCDSKGICQTGRADSACGASGRTCSACDTIPDRQDWLD